MNRGISSPTPSSWAILALLRWALASIVVVTHFRVTFVPDNAVLAEIAALGARAAVMGFFLISGYSIAHSYRVKPQGYFRRRFLRIYPLYFAAIIFTQLVVFLAPSPAQCLGHYRFIATGPGTLLANLLLLQNFAAIAITYDLPLWTLSIEVFYYLLAPFFFRQAPLSLAFLTIGSMAFFALSPANLPLYGYATLVFLWPWLIGFLLGHGRGGLLLPLVLGGLGAVLVATSRTQTAESLSVVTYLISLILIVIAGSFRLPEALRRVADYLGELSYPLYLFHLPLLIFFFKVAGVRSPLLFLVLVVASTAIFYHLFDQKMKTWFWVPLLNRITKRMPAAPENPVRCS